MKNYTLNTSSLKIVFSFSLILFCVNYISAQNTQQTIQKYLEENRIKNGFSEIDIKNWEITNESFSKKIQVNHVYIRQTMNGIPIANGLANFALKNNEVITFANRLIKNVETKATNITPVVTAEQSIEKAATQLGIKYTKGIHKIKTISDHKFIFNKSDISKVSIPVELMYYLSVDGKLILVWDLSIKEINSPNWWSIKLDAISGLIIEKNNWTVSCSFENCNSIDHTHNSKIESTSSFAPTPPPTTDSQYNVYSLPTESPNHGSRTILTNPANTLASPFGWHDVDGVDGDEYTITQGNNVYASEDSDNDDIPGYSPNGGATLNFDFPVNLSLSPVSNLDPCITNLFYLNNVMHDIWYQYGFDEESGNFQNNNYGNGGVGNDFVYADAQDGSGTDNANFETPPDGSNPRMQMFLWSVTSSADDLVINSPSSIAGSYEIMMGSFGPPLPTIPITSDFVLVNDNTAPDINDGCETIINASDIVGKVAIVKRGTCPFINKVQALQDAGAIAVIVINNTASSIFSMGGSSTTITIPSVMISQADGQLILNQIAIDSTVNGTLNNGGGITNGLDADYDNVVIAHEYGHGISIRLTGGASNSDCLNNDEQMGEGWSDWFGLMLTQKSTDLPTDGRGIGTYVTGASTTSTGIRNAPYSTDFSINSYTYNATNNTSSISMPHGIGFVWCTMLWDLNWAFINQYGFNTDLYNGTGGNNKVMNIVIEALKLQPCGPGFVDGRDAILAADLLLYNGDNKCLIWEVFAKRGLGFSANQGDPMSRTDQVQAFDLPAECENGLLEHKLDEISIYPNPTQNSITITTKGKQKIEEVVLTDLQGKIIFEPLKEIDTNLTIDMSKLVDGVYMLSVHLKDHNKVYKIVKD